MLELQKVSFFNWISCNKGLKIKVSRFFTRFFCLTPPCDWNVLEAERPLRSWRLIDWRNTKICIHWASQIKRKRGKCWKLPIFERKLRIFINYLSEMKIISMFCNSSLFWHFLQLVFIIFCSGDVWIQLWQGFLQTFCFHFQIRMIWTAVITLCLTTSHQ